MSRESSVSFETLVLSFMAGKLPARNEHLMRFGSKFVFRDFRFKFEKKVEKYFFEPKKELLLFVLVFKYRIQMRTLNHFVGNMLWH